jgi:hypothetical protein
VTGAPLTGLFIFSPLPRAIRDLRHT